MSELPVEEFAFLLGNDLVQEQVAVTPNVSLTSSYVWETQSLTRGKYPATFPVCVVTCSQAKALNISTMTVEKEAVVKPPNNGALSQQDPVPIDLADIGFARCMVLIKCQCWT